MISMGKSIVSMVGGQSGYYRIRSDVLTIDIASFTDTTLLINPMLYLEKRNLKHLAHLINMLTIHHSKMSHLRTPS